MQVHRIHRQRGPDFTSQEKCLRVMIARDVVYGRFPRSVVLDGLEDKSYLCLDLPLLSPLLLVLFLIFLLDHFADGLASYIFFLH
jgi:hypothetical protein